MSDFKIVRGHDAWDVEKEVREFLNSGYSFHGHLILHSVGVSSLLYIQAMVKHEVPQPDDDFEVSAR